MVLNQLTVFFIIIYVFESLTIIAQSSFTLAILGREWVLVKRLSPAEMILICLGICRFCQQWSSVLSNFCFYFKLNCVLWNTEIIWEFTNVLTFLFASLLAVFYCVKVSCITHPIFFWLRWRILRLVPWLLLSAVVISCVAVIPSAIRTHIQLELTIMEHSPTNSTLIEKLKMFEQNFSKAHKIVVLTIPFLLFLVSTIILMACLIQHWKQMQQHNTSLSNSSLKAHSSALRSLAIFFILFTAYFLMIVLTFADMKSKKGHWCWAWEVIIYAIVSIHSTSLTLSSPTLKKALKIKFWGRESA
ncbi:taste receptor type 2 member 16 [Heterocephalus glaber]|uniref:Taste receptor type 2 n=1 Tax=Heterocephalus glaber TaxID=10181 RepID=A0AAX6PNQ1_HETGA|nr:taste receptor type 2 member 16 [Heterocephalus glaber]